MPLIAARDLCIRYGAAQVLSDVTFAIEPAEIVTLIGPNGSGKSSLIRALMGAMPVSAGTVTRAPNLTIGYMPQSLSIDTAMPITVRRFLNLPQRRASEEIAAAANRTGLDTMLDRQLADLSGGQLRRVLLARAILTNPDILILDEPTQGLDQPGIGAFYRMLEELRSELGCAILMVSHDLHVVMSATDRVICLNGHICCQGRPEVVLRAPEYRALFGPGTGGTMALYRHEHDHQHDHPQEHETTG